MRSAPVGGRYESARAGKVGPEIYPLILRMGGRRRELVYPESFYMGINGVRAIGFLAVTESAVLQ